MQLGSTHLRPKKWDRSRREGLWFYCGLTGHTIAQCLLSTLESSHFPTNYSECSLVCFPTSIYNYDTNHAFRTNDCGHDQLWIGRKLYQSWLKLQLPLQCLNSPPKVSTTDGSSVGEETIQLCTEPIKMQISSLHYKEISLLITNTPNYPTILGIPWLHLHDCQISSY